MSFYERLDLLSFKNKKCPMANGEKISPFKPKKLSRVAYFEPTLLGLKMNYE